MKVDFKTILVLVAVLLVATVGSAYITSWVFTNRASPPPVVGQVEQQPTAEDEANFDPQLLWDAGAYTVNLAPSALGISRFAKVSMSFGVSDRRVLNELQRRKVQVQDRVITILRTTASDQLSNEEGISSLKRRIMDSVNELLETDGRVESIYLTELVIQ